MVEKDFHGKLSNRSNGRNSTDPSSSRVVDYFDAKRTAQRGEFLKREKEKDKTLPQQFRPKKPGKAIKPKVLTFD